MFAVVGKHDCPRDFYQEAPPRTGLPSRVTEPKPVPKAPQETGPQSAERSSLHAVPAVAKPLPPEVGPLSTPEGSLPPGRRVDRGDDGEDGRFLSATTHKVRTHAEKVAAEQRSGSHPRSTQGGNSPELGESPSLDPTAGERMPNSGSQAIGPEGQQWMCRHFPISIDRCPFFSQRGHRIQTAGAIVLA